MIDEIVLGRRGSTWDRHADRVYMSRATLRQLILYLNPVYVNPSSTLLGMAVCIDKHSPDGLVSFWDNDVLMSVRRLYDPEDIVLDWAELEWAEVVKWESQ